MPLTKATQAVIAPNICTTDTAQTITGEKTFTQAIIGDVTGDVTGNVTGDVTGDVTATSVSTTNLVNGSSLCFRNKIINGNFDIWQRGTSLGSGTGTRFLADRFLNTSIGSTYTASRQLFTNGQTDVPNNPDYFHRTVVNSVAGNGNNCVLAQRIESVKTLAGKTATLSFYAKADSNKSIAVGFAQEFGTGGSPSSVVNGIGVQKFNLTTFWQKFTVTANIPSISGKTIGTDSDDDLQITFWFDAGSDFDFRTDSLGQQSGTFDIAQVQLEEGSVATPFEVRPIGTELALCQRYCLAISQDGIASRHIGSGFWVSSTNGNQFINHFVPMRATPTLSISSVSHFSANNGGSVYTLTGLSVDTGSNNLISVLDFTTASGGTSGNASRIYMNNASAKITLSAEF